jgi:S-adenosylmethionine hydrolase
LDCKQLAWLTDFGAGSPYLGQIAMLMKNWLPAFPFVHLVSDLEKFRPDLAAYLIPRLVAALPEGVLYVCVVDPGVGGARDVLAVRVGADWFLGPDNGVLAMLMRHADFDGVYRVRWEQTPRSSSFHGRDVFAPLAARLLSGKPVEMVPANLTSVVGVDWPDDLDKVIYRDIYGNLMTGVRAVQMDRFMSLRAGGSVLGFARTFSEVALGEAFWYENAFGLVELAVNQGCAGTVLGLAPGDVVTRLSPAVSV